jgi:hypothetical protein
MSGYLTSCIEHTQVKLLGRLDRNELILASNVKFKSDHIPSSSHGTDGVSPSCRQVASSLSASGRVDGRDRREAEVESWTLKVVGGRLTTRRRGPVHVPPCLG